MSSAEPDDVMPEPIVVVDYDPQWPLLFRRIADEVGAVLGEIAVAVDHVGSTSVPGCAAKPIIDVDVVVADEAAVPLAIERLASVGYRHRGDLGVPGREAFFAPPGAPRQHLYVVREGNRPHRNHVIWRDLLRGDPELARRYGELKFALAASYGSDRDGYTEAKTDFIVGAIEKAGFRFRSDRAAAPDAP